MMSDRSRFSRLAVAALTAFFLVAVFFYRQYQSAQQFPLIGVVEGFYGTPWTHEARLDMVKFMGEAGMNAYVYAPKDDPFHRSRWRDPYDGAALEQFSELVVVATEAGVDLYYAISPGLSIQYSSEEDYKALYDKLLAMKLLGVMHVALFLDDVPEYLQHPNDKEQFANLAEAHVSLINRLYGDLRAAGLQLIVCPTTYTDAWGNRDYVKILGEGIPAEIPLFWTGTDVAPATITRDHARFWGGLMQRKPLIWDNFPVNDFEVWRPIMGPLAGRDAALVHETTGIFANPMDAPYLSMISLYTVAEYARRPFSYDAAKAWQNALTHLAGEDGARALRPLAMLYRDYGWTDNVFTPLYTPGKQLSINQIRDALEVMDESLAKLESSEFAGNRYIQNILPELRPFALNTRARFEAMLADPFNRIDPEGFLVFQRELEEILAEGGIAQIDGNLQEWSQASFKKLNPATASEAGRVETAFKYASDTLFVAVRVQTDTLVVPANGGWMGGDQVLMAVDFTPKRSGTWIDPTDLLLLVRPGGEVLTGSMYLTPFSQRGISDITMRTISSFFAHFVMDPHQNLEPVVAGIRTGFMRTRTGYNLEIALPVNNLSEVNVSISVNDARSGGGTVRSTNFMLSQRPYIGNPNTWVPIILK